MLHVGDRPLRLLRAVKGIDLQELPEADECCGFGGTFSVKNADTSIAMLTDKVRTILDTGAEVCASADNSCLMHIGGALSRQRAGVRTMHIAEILAQTDARRERVTTPSMIAESHPRSPFPTPPGRRSPTPSCGATSGTRRTRSAPSAPRVVAELPDWEELREAGRAIKERTLRHLDAYLLELEESVTRAGGVVHWARDAEECQPDRRRPDRRPRRRRGGQGQVADDRGDRTQRGARRRAGSAPGRPTWPS